jgi:methylphosphotriester-DNA--protein-cysteine methyltransferase
MIRHIDLGSDAKARQMAVRRLILSGQIHFGGYLPGKIYGRLSCASGKKMKVENRVFFQNEQEAIAAGYRPCGHCLRDKYREWKSNAIS